MLWKGSIVTRHLLEFQDAHAPRLFFGREEDIRLAVLKDEIVELQSRLQRTETGYLIPTISTLQQRVREMEKNGSEGHLHL